LSLFEFQGEREREKFLFSKVCKSFYQRRFKGFEDAPLAAYMAQSDFSFFPIIFVSCSRMSFPCFSPLTNRVSAFQNIFYDLDPQEEKMSKRILSVSYDLSLLATRQMLLEQQGYTVISALGFKAAIVQCRNAEIDLFILGHSIPYTDKNELIRTFRRNCSAPVLSLERQDEDLVRGDFHTSPDDPKEFLRMVENILDGGNKTSDTDQHRSVFP
jgi:CheY-like chemotaxis protein